jgi:phosphoheptose isomerase
VVLSIAVNFAKIVDGKYNVLIQLAEYDWKLESTYNRVAESFADRKDLLIASLETSGDNDALIKV